MLKSPHLDEKPVTDSSPETHVEEKVELCSGVLPMKYSATAENEIQQRSGGVLWVGKSQSVDAKVHLQPKEIKSEKGCMRRF